MRTRRDGVRASLIVAGLDGHLLVIEQILQQTR